MSSSQPLPLSSSAAASAATTTKQTPTSAKKKKCDGCGKEEDADLQLKMCGACHSVSYCSSACQTTGWTGHKAACKRIQLRIRNGSGAGTVDMGSPLVALSSAVKRYTEADLYKACGRGQYEELQKVLGQTGLDSNWAAPDHGSTAVYAAAQQGHDKCLSAVIQYGGADLSKVNKGGDAPIHAACRNGRIACLILLLDHGVEANVPAANKSGSTPAVLCCIVGHVKCLALLLDRGADPDLVCKGGYTPIHIACGTGHLNCVQLLIARGANYNAKDSTGRTPLDRAREWGHTACVDLLLKNNAVESGVYVYAPTEAEKGKYAETQKNNETSRENAKRCDYPPCNASAADKNMIYLKKCPRCNEGRYCCQEHCNLDWDRHKLLCRDIPYTGVKFWWDGL